MIESASRTPFSRDALDNVVIALATQIRALPGFIPADKPDSKGSMLPSSGTRYSPAVLVGDMEFQMTPDGKVGKIAFRDIQDTTLAHDLKVALRAVAAAAPKQDPDSTVVFHDFLLVPSFVSNNAIASFPLFRMFAPVSRPAAMERRSHKEMPEEFQHWTASMYLSFVVDTAGKIVHESIQTGDISTLTFKTPQEREMYGRYIDASKTFVEDSKFTPAEFIGCRVAQRILFNTNFRTH